jgi:SAM-dependent methyltransferase
MGVRKILLIIAIIALLPLYALPQSEPERQVFTPTIGAPGKDVIWWPTPDLLVKSMLEMAKVVPGDTVIDLGSGDGRVVIAAAKRGAYAIGIEYERKMIELSVRRATEEGVTERAVFVNTDLFEFDLSAGTVISLYLLPELNLRLRPRLLTLKPGTRIVSNTFDMDDWDPDDQVTVEYTEEETPDNSLNNEYKSSNALLWIVPANVEGAWVTEEGELYFSQHFQQLSGTFKTETKNIEIRAGRLRGNEISFEIDDMIFTGFVSEHQISGTMTSDNITRKWSAIRSSGQK